MSKPYLTKFALGSHWFYRDTRRQWKRRTYGKRWPLIVISYRKAKG